MWLNWFKAPDLKSEVYVKIMWVQIPPWAFVFCIYINENYFININFLYID